MKQPETMSPETPLLVDSVLLKELSEAATPPPWDASTPGATEPKSPAYIGCGPSEIDEDTGKPIGEGRDTAAAVFTGQTGKLASFLCPGKEYPVGQHHVNARLIAEMRNALPALLDVVHAAEWYRDASERDDYPGEYKHAAWHMLCDALDRIKSTIKRQP